MKPHITIDLNVNKLSEKYGVAVSVIRSIDLWLSNHVSDKELSYAADEAKTRMAQKYNVAEQEMHEILLNRVENARVFRKAQRSASVSVGLKTHGNVKLVFKSLAVLGVGISVYYFLN